MFPGYPQPKGAGFQSGRSATVTRRGWLSGRCRTATAVFPVQSFRWTRSSTSTTRRQSNKSMAEWMQAQWKQNLGITISLRNMEWKTFLNARAKLEYKGFSRGAWGADYMDPFTFLSVFYTLARERHRLARSEIRCDARRGQSHVGPQEALRVVGRRLKNTCSRRSRSFRSTHLPLTG